MKPSLLLDRCELAYWQRVVTPLLNVLCRITGWTYFWRLEEHRVVLWVVDMRKPL
jgi:hypothetical protein